MDLTLGSGWPYGGPQVPVGEAAGRLRIVRTRDPPEGARRLPCPTWRRAKSLSPLFSAAPQDKSESARIHPRNRDIKDGAVELPAGLARRREVLFFISSRTGMMVKRPAVGAEGFVLNHYDRAAVEQISEECRRPPDAGASAAILRTPSSATAWKFTASDWTGDFLEEFHKRRGYDLKPAPAGARRSTSARRLPPSATTGARR